MPAANPMNAYAPETSHRVMPALWRSDDKHHAANAITAALASAIKLISGSSRDVLARSEKHMGGTTRANMRTTQVARRHSVRAVGTTVEVAFCRVDMVLHALEWPNNPDRKTVLRGEVGVTFSPDKRI